MPALRTASRRLSRLAMGRTPPFALERYFAEHEFTCKHALCSSDTEAVSLAATLETMSGETRALWDGLDLGYTEVKGHPRLLAALAASYRLEPASFQELAPQEGILLAYAALLGAGDRVVATAPGYQSFYTCAEAAGARVDFWYPRADGGGALRFRAEDLEALCDREETKCVAVNFPHNPTGALPTVEEWAAIVRVCERRGCYLFADEIYRGLAPPGVATLAPAAAAYARGISLGGVSKAYGMPGARVGWLASRDAELLARVAELRDYTTICSSAPSQILALAAIEGEARALERANGFCDAGRRAVDAVLADFADDLAWGAGPAAGPVGWVELQAGASAAAYADALVRSDAGLLLLPSTLFDAGDSHVRVGFGRADSPAIMDKWRATLDDPTHPATALLRA